MIKLTDILKEGTLILTQEERYQVEKILPKVIDIIKGPQIDSKEYKKVDWIYYQFADKTPGQVYIYVGNDKPNAGGYFQTNDPKNPTDNYIVIQQNNYSKYFGIGSKIRKTLTGQENQGIELLRSVIKHELIHAKDPAKNHHYLKEPYDSSKAEIYYKSWTEFQTMTGQFLEAIVSRIDNILRQDPSDKNIRNIEFALKNILQYFAGKDKNLYQPTVDFIQNTRNQNYFQKLLQKAEYDLISLGVLKYKGNALNSYMYYINQIKKYHPEAWNEFLKDLYKTIDQAKDKINIFLDGERKSRTDFMKKSAASIGLGYVSAPQAVPTNVKIKEMQHIKEAKRFQHLAGIITENKDKYQIQLLIDGKAVMEITADDNPTPEELRDALTVLETKYKDKFDFNKAELIVLDPKGNKVGSLSKKDTFLAQKTKKTGISYPSPGGHYQL